MMQEILKFITAVLNGVLTAELGAKQKVKSFIAQGQTIADYNSQISEATNSTEAEILGNYSASLKVEADSKVKNAVVFDIVLIVIAIIIVLIIS